MKEALLTNFFKDQTNSILSGFCVLTILSIWIGISTNMFYLVAIPIALVIFYLAIVDFKQLFWLLLFSIPISTEIDLPGGFTLDLPDEPLMIGLMGLSFFYFLKPNKNFNSAFFKHPITLVLFLHLAWIFSTAITSQLHFVSFKFFAAKIWYVMTFFFLAGVLIQGKKDWKITFWVIGIPLILTVMYVLIRHAGEGFSLSSINKMVRPFYRNHVNYACLMVLFMPFMWYALYWYKKYSFKWWMIVGGIIILFLGIQFSYTRAAYVALIAAIGANWIIKKQLVKPVLVGASIVLLTGVLYFTTNNTYLQYAPDYNKTITHENFGNLLSATTKGQDVSTMERVYRWVAALNMVQDRPVLGFGPGNFTRFYKGYTVSNFKTYVSNNEDSSGVHNYFFTVAVEQGIIGLLLFVALCFITLIKGEQIYHETTSIFHKRAVLTVMLSYIIILLLLLMNDMIETDKVGAFFFLFMAVLVNLDLRNKSNRVIER